MATTQVLDVAELGAKNKEELVALASDIGLEDGSALNGLRREEVLGRILQVASNQQALVASGVLETMDDGYGFLRQMGYRQANSDVYISQSQIRRFGLRTGDTVTGQVRPPKEGERYFGLVRVEKQGRERVYSVDAEKLERVAGGWLAWFGDGQGDA